ncbi:MAG: hypothetical protein F4213_09875 [Boseongicola sp. SB0677_bin_26]|nr:hypothetical protein [Boseongicola sp. SB0665_bin_10]MYG26318.1 hypothetical protein [Boseongicola sp. SB0677_bin_26]
MSANAGIFGAEQVRCKLHPLPTDRMATLGSRIDHETAALCPTMAPVEKIPLNSPLVHLSDSSLI